MKRKIRSSFTFFYVFLILSCFMSPDSRAQPERTVTVQGEADPYEVTLYRWDNYKDPIGTWKLAPGMRMLRIPQLDKIPHSIFLGSKVGALLFPDHDFVSTLQGASSKTVNVGSWDEPKDKYLIPYFRFKNSTPTMFSKYAPSYRCSLVIHRKDIDDFLGVYLQSGNYAGWFFPLPDKARESSAIYYKIPEGGPWTLSVLAGGLGTVSLYPSLTPPNPNDLTITITAPNGMTLKIPEPKCTTTQFDLSKQGVQQISSLMVQYKGPFDEQAYLPPKAVRAPPAPDPPKPADSLATGKQGPGTIQGGQAAQGPKPEQLTALKTPDVSGTWKSSIGLVYEIRQRGDQFGWSVANSDEKGRGSCQGKAVSATWSGSAGTGSAKGNITGVDASGKATRVEWDNGVIFFR